MSIPTQQAAPPELHPKDFLVSGERFTVAESGTPGILKTSPLPENLQPYYESEAYISHTDRRKTLLEKLYYWAKKWNLERKVDVLKSTCDGPGILLDIGAGTGDFLKAASKAGWACYGVEPHGPARMRAQEKGVEVQATIDSLELPQADVITLWHVLEHIPELEKQVTQMRKVLRPGGQLILALPNFRSYDATYYGSFWAGYDVPRHVWHFSKEGVAAYFHDKGFRLEETKPMWLDAFYVSWLSEKYRKNHLGPLAAFFVGLWSNIRALVTGEWSSLIYVLHKSD